MKQLFIAALLLAGISFAQEDKLIDILKSNAPTKEKADACEALARIGTVACIPALAKLLPDEKLSHMARYALEPMPYPEASKALRDALDQTEGLAKVGLITSLGFREDKQAVPRLAELLKDPDTRIVSAAATALGRSGTPEASAALGIFRAAVPQSLQGVAAEASLTVAGRLLGQGMQERAAAIYEELRAEKWPQHVRIGAFVGLLAARPEEATSLVFKAVSGEDPMLRAVAIAQVGGLKGKGIGERFTAELPKLPTDVQVLLIHALAERGDAAAGPAILASVSSVDPKVRIVAIAALGKLGDVGCVEILCRTLAEGGSDAEKEAAGKSLCALRGDGIDAALVKGMQESPVGVRPELIGVLMDRGATSAVPALLEQAAGKDVKTAAMASRALGRLAGPEDLPPLLKLVLRAGDDTVAREVERAAVKVSVTIAEEARRADAALEVMKAAKTASGTCALLRVLSGIGNENALEAVRRASTDRDAPVQDAAVRALADWPDPRAVDSLRQLIRTTTNETHRVLALRGCVRLLGLQGRSEKTLTIYRELIEEASRANDRKLLIGGLGQIPDPAALEIVAPFLVDNEVKNEAELALLSIAKSIAGSAPDRTKAAANKLLATSSNERTRQMAAELIKQSDRFQDYIVAWQVSDRQTGKEKTGDEITWHALTAGEHATPWMLDLAKNVGGNNCSAYARTWIHSAVARDALLEMGADDSLQVWLNEKLVHTNPTPGAAVPGEEKINVRLQEGWNLLRLKIDQLTGPWEFCARLRTPDGQNLDGLLVDANREPLKQPAAKKEVPVKRAPPLVGDWTPLFNGKDLTGWDSKPGWWTVEDGALTAESTPEKPCQACNYIIWRGGRPADFELLADFRLSRNGNSGIQIRSEERPDWDTYGYQADMTGDGKLIGFVYHHKHGLVAGRGSKALFTADGKSTVEQTSDPDVLLKHFNQGDWNTYHVVCKGPDITLYINSVLMCQITDHRTTQAGSGGIIALQMHPGPPMKIQFKNIRLKELM